jgi:hypothetical protein
MEVKGNKLGALGRGKFNGRWTSGIGRKRAGRSSAILVLALIPLINRMDLVFM